MRGCHASPLMPVNTVINQGARGCNRLPCRQLRERPAMSEPHEPAGAGTALKRVDQQRGSGYAVTETVVSVRRGGAVKRDGQVGGGEATIRPLGRPGDLGWVVMAHGEVYAAEYGFNGEFEALVAKIVADYAAGPDPRREAAWIAELERAKVGCIFCVTDPDDAACAKLRLLLVHPNGRGH